MSLYEDIKTDDPNADDKDIRDYIWQESAQLIADIKEDNPDADDNSIFEYISQESGMKQSLLFAKDNDEVSDSVKVFGEDINTTKFNERDSLELEINQEETEDKIAKIEVVRNEVGDKKANLAIKKLMLEGLDLKASIEDKYTQSEDNKTTKPTKLAFGMGATLDKPIYKTDIELGTELQSRQEIAKKEHLTNPFTTTIEDPQSGTVTTMSPEEEGLVDDSLAVLPIGKLGYTASKAKQITTEFGKKIKTLPIDEQKEVVKMLKFLEEEGVERLDEIARDKLLKSVFEGSVDEAALAKRVKSEIDNLAKISDDKVKTAYKEANTEAREIKVIKEKVPETTVKTTRDKVTGLPKKVETTKVNKVLKEEDNFVSQFKYKPKDEDEAILVRSIKARLQYKWNKNIEDMESTIRGLKAKQRSAIGGDKDIYGKAISIVQKRQDKLGGVGIYKKARELSKEHNVQFKGTIDAEDVTAGASAGRVSGKKYTEDISEKLLGGKIDPNRIGEAVKGLTKESKEALLQEALYKGASSSTVEGKVNALVSNWNKMNRSPEGIKKLVGEPAYKKLRSQVESIASIQANIKQLNSQDLGIAKDVLQVAEGAILTKVSPIFGAKTVTSGVSNILSKTSKTSQKATLIKRVKTIKDTNVRRNLLKAITFSYINTKEE